MKEKLLQIYLNEQFRPGLIGLFINPFYFARRGLFNELRSMSTHVKGKVLDIGCGQKPYETLFDCTAYTGLEIDTPEHRLNKKVDIHYDGKNIPADNETYDTVITSQVLEHVFEPQEFLQEIKRVLKPGGGLLITVPFIWDEHSQPHDFGRYTSFGIRHLLEQQGFEIIEIKKSMKDIRLVFQMINAYLYKILNTKNLYVNTVLTLIFMAPFNLLGTILSLVTPDNEDLYLDNVVFAKKL